MVSMALSWVSSASLTTKCNFNSALPFIESSNLRSSTSTFIRNEVTALSPIVFGFSLKCRSFASVSAITDTEKTIHHFTVKSWMKNRILTGRIALTKFKGSVLLIVNVASKCGLTSSNYSELSHLYQKYKTQGFEILAFPCNQFRGQEPGSNAQIKEFVCTQFKAEFPIFDKVDVNGPNTAPVYEFLKSNDGGLLGDLIKWNFEKFLVDKNGKVFKRYGPRISPFQIEEDIQKLVAA